MAKLFNLEASGYFYTRLQNPTNDYVAAKIAALEGGAAGMLTSSGQAANFYAVFNIASCGDHVVSSSAIYGGTFNLFAVTMKRWASTLRSYRPTARKKNSKRRSAQIRKRCSAKPSQTPRLPLWTLKIRAGSASTRRSVYYRQYVRNARAMPSYRVGRGYRNAFHDEIYGRSRCGGRRRNR